MEKVFNFIKSSNQVLLFLASLLLIFMLSKELIGSLFREQYEPAKVEIVNKSSAEAAKSKPEHEIDFFGQLKDVYVFQISSKVIERSGSSFGSSGLGAKIVDVERSAYTRRHYLRNNVVNMVFVKEDGTKKTLLNSDSLIRAVIEVRIPDEDEPYRIDKNTYLIVSNDSNHDGYLDHEDKSDLYTSSYDGSDLSKILEDILTVQIIGDNKLLVEQSGKFSRFYLYDLADSSLKELDTKIPTIK